MAKTNPIGVRFDQGLLKQVMDTEKLSSPQQVVNFLLQEYGRRRVGDSLVVPENPVDRIEAVQKSVDGVSGILDKTDILSRIKAIKAEKIPPERDTPLGRRVWKYEQDKKVAELEGLLNS